MPLDTYGGLKASVASWLARDDLTDQIPDFISFAEAMVRNGHEDPTPQLNCDPLRIRAMETAIDVDITSREVPLPDGYLGVRSFHLDTQPKRDLEYLTPEDLRDRWLGSTSGIPRFYTVEGNSFVFGPGPDGDYTGKLNYYKAFATLTGDNDTNWLLENAPQVMLYGALYHAEPFVGSERALQWLGMYKAACNAVMNADRKDRYAGRLQMRPPVSDVTIHRQRGTV